MSSNTFPFLDRKKETSRIVNAIERDNPQLIVLYGRRRCGKSRLLTEILDPQKDIYYHADRTDSQHQIAMFAKQVATIITDFDRVIYPDWESLLTSISARVEKKHVVCIDEFPYLVKSEPSLPSVIQRLHDTGKLKFDLILCGSSQQMMNSSIISSSAPLYGRADEIIKIQPLQPFFLKSALSLTGKSAIEEYAVWGGVPRYWELRSRRNSLLETIMEDVMNSDGILYDEPSRLFLDEMRDVELSASILSLVGNGCNRLSEIAARLERPSTSLAGPINRLISYGYMFREVPFSESERNSKRSLYKISDPFLNFYFHFVTPNRSQIEFGRQDRIKAIIESSFPSYVGEMWEQLCRKAIPLMTINGKTFSTAKRWWGNVDRKKTAEIDVVSESDDATTILVGECKWTSGEDTERLLADLMYKAEKLPFINGRNILPVLFLKEKNKPYNNTVCFFPDDIIDQFGI